jgi:carboxylesterase
MEGPADIIYIIHGTNVHAWWYRLLFGSRAWWKPSSSFAEAVRAGFAGACQVRTHEWTGRNRHSDRVAAAESLAARIRREYRKDDRIHLVGHSHGGNIALLAAHSLDEPFIETIVLLATPHMAVFYAADGRKARRWLYWGQAAEKTRMIWNLYSPQDMVQTFLSNLFNGVSLRTSARRVRETSKLTSVRNGSIAWRRYDAHSKMRSPEMGLVAGKLMRGADFNEISQKFKPDPFAIGRNGDVGVLLVHGFTASPTETRPLAEYVCRLRPDWYCRGILLPGHGETVEALEETTSREWLDAVENAYLELTKTCSHIFLAGVSMGAVLCCHVARRHRADSKIRGVILIAPAFGFTRGTQLGIRLLKPFVRYMGKGSAKADYFGDNQLFSYTKFPLAQLGQVADLGREAYAGLGDLENTPILMFVGKREKTVSLEQIRGAHETNPWIEFHELKDSGHILTVEPDREELFEKSLAFMRKQLEKEEARIGEGVSTTP